MIAFHARSEVHVILDEFDIRALHIVKHSATALNVAVSLVLLELATIMNGESCLWKKRKRLYLVDRQRIFEWKGQRNWSVYFFWHGIPGKQVLPSHRINESRVIVSFLDGIKEVGDRAHDLSTDYSENWSEKETIAMPDLRESITFTMYRENQLHTSPWTWQ